MVFTSTSYWNTMVPKELQPDTSSDRYIGWLKYNNRNNYLSLAVGDWAMPVSRSILSDPVVTIDPSGTGPTVTFRLPKYAEAMEGNDAALLVLDPYSNQVISLFEFSRDSKGKPRATGVGRYWMDSEGLDFSVGGTPGNSGHRGIPGSAMCVRSDQLAADRITTRFKIAIPGTGEWHAFPMSGHESGKGGIIGEGMVIRIKPGVDLAAKGLSPEALKIARGLRQYGAVIGDNGGVAALKIEKGVTLLERDALAAISWDEYEFIPRGWRP